MGGPWRNKLLLRLLLLLPPSLWLRLQLQQQQQQHPNKINEINDYDDTKTHNHRHLRLAPQVRSATGRQQPPEWSVLGQVNCVGPWQPVEVEVVLHRLHPGHPRSSWWSLPIHRRGGSQDLLCVYTLHCRPFGRYARIGFRRRAWIFPWVEVDWSGRYSPTLKSLE